MQATKDTLRLNEHGESSLRMLFILSVISATMYAAFQMFTAYDAYWTFEKNVETLLRFAFVNIQVDRQQKIVRQINGMLDDMGVQYDTKDVDVAVNEGTKQISVDVWYSQRINLPYYPNPKRFHVHLQRADAIG